MGFGTILGMYNLRVALKRFAEAISSRNDISVKSEESRGNAKLKANGFSPGLDYLCVSKGDEVLFEIDASDDDGSSNGGKKELEAFRTLNKALEAGEIEKAVEALDELVRQS